MADRGDNLTRTAGPAEPGMTEAIAEMGIEAERGIAEGAETGIAALTAACMGTEAVPI